MRDGRVNTADRLQGDKEWTYTLCQRSDRPETLFFSTSEKKKSATRRDGDGKRGGRRGEERRGEKRRGGDEGKCRKGRASG